MNIPRVTVERDLLTMSITLTCLDKIGLDVELHLENFNIKLIERFLGQAMNNSVIQRIQQDVNQELNYLVSVGILHKNYFNQWYMTMLTDIDSLGLKDIYIRALTRKYADANIIM
jgi:hypothetical protein